MTATAKTITIATVIDVVGTLATDSLSDHTYFIDTNARNGSVGQGTEDLKTVVAVGNRLVWVIYPLECEAYVDIDDIVIDKEICEPEKNTYTGTDIAYWAGIVKKDVTLTPYTIKFTVGNRPQPIATTSSLCLMGKNT